MAILLACVHVELEGWIPALLVMGLSSFAFFLPALYEVMLIAIITHVEGGGAIRTANYARDNISLQILKRKSIYFI